MRTLVCLALVGVLAAQAAADGDHAEADRLFLEAQTLKEAGQQAEACKKFQEALAKNQNAVGTLLNVAKCSEDAGKIATAVKLYTQARELAREHSLTEHLAAAETRLAAIAERVPRLTVAFAERLDGMKLVIDDVVFPTTPGATNDLRLDPGTRHVVVTAPDRLSYSTNVTLVESTAVSVSIPELARAVTVSKARRTVGKILTFSGAGLAVTGLVVGYVANRDYEREVGGPNSMKPCIVDPPGSKPLCDAEGYQRTGAARQLGNFGTAVGLVGVAALTVGVVLWFTAPAESERVSLVPAIDNESAVITAVGRF
jgi:hypothetical protein